MSYLPNIATGNTLWVDAVNGDDSTGIRGKEDKPFLTILAAIAAATPAGIGIPGDLISVRPGIYPETATLDITGISLVSTGGWENTTIGDGSITAYDVITVGIEGYIQGFSILIPNSVQAAVECSQVSGTNSIYDVTFYGTGTTGAGTGINRTGGGKTIGGNIRIEGGGMANALRVDSGVLALEGIHVPQSAGTIDNVLLCTVNVGPTTGGRAQMIGFNTGSTNVTNAIRTEGGVAGLTNNPTALIFTPNIFNCTNALSTDGEYQTSNLLGGRIENVTYAVIVDLAATSPGTANSVYRVTSNHQPNYLYPPSSAFNSDFSLVYSQETSDERDSSFNIFGPDQLSAGVTERGIEASFGRGAPYTNGMVVLTTDSTATDILDGGNITDISSTAGSKAGTFQFQGTAANHTIIIGSLRKDEALNALKFYGLDAIIDTGDTTGTYAFDIYSSGRWEPITTMCTSQLEGYPYGQSYFLRDDSSEFYRFGIDNTFGYKSTGNFEFTLLTWDGTHVISGITSYWVRIRKTNSVGNPTFQRFKLIDSSFNISKNGIPSGTGLGMFRKTIGLSGRVWSSSLTGGMTPTIDLGTYAEILGDTTGDNWVQEINYSIAVVGDTLSVQFPIPIGVCTAFPIKVSCAFEFLIGGMAAVDLVNDPITITTRALPQPISNNLIADSTGGKALVRRSYLDTLPLSAAGSRAPNNTILVLDGSNDIIEGAVGATTWAALNTMLHEIELCQVDVSTCYEDDLIIFNIEYTTDVSAVVSIVPFALIIEGVFHQDGAGI